MRTLAIKPFSLYVIADYLRLAKPRTIFPHLITAAAAIFLATGSMPLISLLVFTLAGGACVAAAANTFNSYLDRDIDALMTRTQRRPLPSGQLKPNNALAFGITIGLIGVFILSQLVNWTAATLAVMALAYYIIPYTLWLKRQTFWSVIVGSGIGALPPLIGWAAVSPRIEVTPFLLAAIIILWTIPHFWTLAIFRREDYELAGLKVLPDKGAITWIVICTILVVAVTVLLAPIANLGLFYLVISILLGVIFLILALRLNTAHLPKAWHLYRYSIVYITMLFISMIIDRIVF